MDGPVLRRADGSWLLVGHPEVVSAAEDPDTFSSAVSARRAIPNSLDGAEHAAYRRVVDRFLTAERVAALEPTCREVASAIVSGLPRNRTVRTLAEVGVPYAVRVQSAWLGWPVDLEDELVAWVRDNHDATRSGERHRTAAVADRGWPVFLSLGWIGVVPTGVPAGEISASTWLRLCSASCWALGSRVV